jgi:hypothetical protein
MSYNTFSISALADIPSIVGTQAAGEGWTVDSANPNQPLITHPTLLGAVQMRLRSTEVSLDEDLIFETAPSPGTNPSARIRSPKLGNNSVPNPTTLHLFCKLTPEPYIAIVVEYGFNSYRHLYFGYLEKVGTFTGGEVLAAATYDESTSLIQVFNEYSNRLNQYLCRGSTIRWSALQCGGARVVHANNPSAWRKFCQGQILSGLDRFGGDEAYGGYFDGVNDGYLLWGKSSFVASNILVPINLYLPRNPGSTAYFAPVGRLAGVRMINIKDLDPGTQISVSTDNWRVFAAFSKRDEIKPTGTSPNIRPDFETSRYFGYAYSEA